MCDRRRTSLQNITVLLLISALSLMLMLRLWHFTSHLIDWGASASPERSPEEALDALFAAVNAPIAIVPRLPVHQMWLQRTCIPRSY